MQERGAVRGGEGGTLVGERGAGSGGRHREERGGSASTLALDFTREIRVQWLREREECECGWRLRERERVGSQNPRFSIYVTLELDLLGWRARPDLPRRLELKCPPWLMIYRGSYIRMPASINIY